MAKSFTPTGFHLIVQGWTFRRIPECGLFRFYSYQRGKVVVTTIRPLSEVSRRPLQGFCRS